MDDQQQLYEAILSVMCEASLQAGQFIMAHYKHRLPIDRKANASPVTIADQGAEDIILKILRANFAHIPIIAEEEVARGVHTPLQSCFFLVDPLDGTREFIAQNDEFTVNIAFINKNSAILGAIFIPAQQKLYIGSPKGAFLYYVENGKIINGKAIQTRQVIGQPVAVMSRSHRCSFTDQWLDQHHISNRVALGSSLKFCLLAEGQADIYPRFEPCMTWDVAAGDAILHAAGGIMLDEKGDRVQYGLLADTTTTCHKQGLFVAAGDREFCEKLFADKITS